MKEPSLNVSERLDLYFRAHTIAVDVTKEERGGEHPTKRPSHALIFSSITKDDEKQELLFGAYISARLKGDQFVTEEIGLFHRGGHPEESRILERFAKDTAFELGTLDEFRRKILLKYVKAGALIVAYDVPFELSRIAVYWNKSSKRRRGFSFYFRTFADPKTGTTRPSGFEPGILIESLDATKAIYRPLKYMLRGRDAGQEEEQQISNVHILDLKTLVSALTGETLSFWSASQMFGTPASRASKPQRRVTKPAIEHLLRNVAGELELLNRLHGDFAPHAGGLPPQRCYSPATLAKNDFGLMGIKPPQGKFKIPHQINGIAMQAFYAGRAECLIRRMPVPVTYVDFHAQFPAVSDLLNCREILCAQSLKFPDFTAEARSLIERVKLDDCFQPAFWTKQLRWYALVVPCQDVLPLRAKFGQRVGSEPTLGWNYLTSKQPIWITGPDAVAARLTSGKPIKILEAFAVVPQGVQPGLKPIKPCGQLEVDPLRNDLAVKLVEQRTSVKEKNPNLAGGLKVAANSAAFGLLCQVNVKDLDSAFPLHVFSGQTSYLTPKTKLWEQPAEFYCPILASLVTGGSHLFCAMLERAVGDIGGQIAAMDTDSAMIISTEKGGFVPCVGGPYRLKNYTMPSGHSAVRALSYKQVDQIRVRFETLNPWCEALKVPFLKLEKENFGADGQREQLYAYCISAKLYCLFNRTGDELLVRKPSGHGLGFLQAPYSIADWERKRHHRWTEVLPPWIFEAWHFILSRELDLPRTPPRWLKQPAAMAMPITTPQVLERLGYFKETFRPFTVVTVPFPQKEVGVLWAGYFVMPYSEKLDDLHGRPMVNVVSGETFFIHDKHSSALRKSPGWLSLKTMGDEINQILSRTESKFCASNGARCTSKTIGLLTRRHIHSGEFHYIGREASTRWAGGADLSMMADAGILDPSQETFREYERVVDPKYLDGVRAEAKRFSTKLLSRKSGVAECAIRSFKKGKDTVRPRTLRKLTRMLARLRSVTETG